MKQKGIVGTIVLVIICLVVLFLINDAFLAKPYRITGEQVIAPFQANQMVLAERVTYLFRKPSIGDRVIFNPLNQDTYATHIGIVTKIDNKNGVTTYNIISVVGSHEPWTVSTDKIIRKIYFPFIDSSEEQKIALTLQPTSNPPIPELPTSPDTTNWKTYTNSAFKYQMNYPEGWTIEESGVKYLTNQIGEKVPVETTILKDNKSSLYISIIGNFQGGFCEGEGCQEENFKTTSGLTGKQYASKTNLYYTFPLGTNSLFITSQSERKETVDQILSTFKLLP